MRRSVPPNRRLVRAAALLLLVPVLSAPPLQTQERIDYDMVTRIRQEGFRDSKVMETAGALTDGIGARLTGSPNMKKANDWTRDKLAEWGLANAHLEKWGPFGRGWSYESVSVRMTSPDVAQLSALPKAWSPGTNGPVRGKVVLAKLTAKEDFEKQKGKLKGLIVLTDEMREVKPQEKAALERYDEKALEELWEYGAPALKTPFGPEEFRRRREFRRALNKFLEEEKPLAVIDPGRLDGGTFAVQQAGSGWRKEEPLGVPAVVMAIEHYGRMARLIEQGKDVELELDVRTRFHDDDPMSYNTVAEIPGTEKMGQLVMLGAHMDSWHGGTGATDNAAGVAVAMEAVRILRALGAKPLRTIRIALWSGEEQGLLGSEAYVMEHFASRPVPADPKERENFSLRRATGPLTVKPEHAKLSAYFNVDNGTGKIRGIYAQENAAVVPIFERWLEPLKDLGATTVTMRNTRGTDHESFDAVGLPAFQFVQDGIEYETRTHHTNQDVYERLQRDDLMQASVVLATFVWQAAMRDAKLPRKPLPKENARPAATPAPAASRKREFLPPESGSQSAVLSSQLSTEN
ncbi:MAG TPA: M20/M25/M40 family metallo-hydrolase [Thermoanaerobaculia bacterium]|nr:M20/M25/M40 family metallo-hydrolase [Thermoanaerobaculia bacterium]